MTLIPILALGTYLFIALKVFRDDKLAYVFDSTSNMSASMATQVKMQLNSVLGTSKTLFQDFLFQGQFTELSQKIFANESQVEAIAAFKMAPQDTQFIKQNILEKAPGLFDGYWSQWQDQGPALMRQAVKNH